jgi:hypothetical protein
MLVFTLDQPDFIVVTNACVLDCLLISLYVIAISFFSAFFLLVEQVETMGAKDEKRKRQEKQNRTATPEVKTVPITNKPGERSKSQSKQRCHKAADQTNARAGALPGPTVLT